MFGYLASEVCKQTQRLFGSVLLFPSIRLQLEVFGRCHLYAQQHVQTGQQHCNHHSFLKREAAPIPLSSLSMCTARFPGLHASAFDPDSRVWLSSMGHHMRAGSGFSTGSTGKKPGPQRGRKEKLKSRLLGERRRTAYQRAYMIYGQSGL